MDSRFTPPLLALILLLAMAVRVIHVNGQSFFVDEVAEILLAKKSPAQILRAPDSAPPLFPLILKAWLTMWGTDAAARWLSVVCGVLSVGVVWAIGRRLVDDATGLAAAFATAMLPMHVYYSQFVRAYSLMFLLVAAALWCLLRALASNRWRDWVAFVLLAVLGAYTHYYFAIFVATSVPIACLLQRRWWIAAKPLAAYTAISLASLPLLWFLQTDLQYQKALREPRPLSLATFGYTYFSFFSGYSLGPSTTELQTMRPAQAVRAAAPWLAAVGFVLLVLGYHGALKLHRHRLLPTAIVLILLPVLLVFGLSYALKLNYNVRFVTWVMIPVAMWIGAGMTAGGRSWSARLAILAFVILSAIAMYNRHALARYQHEDLRSAAAYLRANASPDDTIYVLSDYLTIPVRYYLGDNWRVVELPAPHQMGRGVRQPQEAHDAIAATVLRHPPGQVCWLIYSRPFHGDPEGHLLTVLLNHVTSKSHVAELAGVAIYRLDRP
jgi:predicted membrane-bound mannosyltransferase